MNLKEAIANNATIRKVVMKTSNAAPTIAFCVGAVGSVASLYLMWRTARKHDDVICDAQDLIEEVHDKKPVEGEENEEALTITQYRAELVKAYIKAGFKIGKLYAPVAIVEAGSLALMSLGYGGLSKRYTGTLAALTLVEHEYSAYRKRVIDSLGEDADREFRFGLKKKEFEVPVLDENGNQKLDKNGKPKTKKIIEQVLENEDDIEGYSMYARIFDKEHSKQFDGDYDDMATSYYNRAFLFKAQEYFNMLLKYRGTIFLNEVYRYLGYEETQAGQEVGWHYDPDHPTGDNKIEFVPIEFYSEKYQTKSAILDFNVDGPVRAFLEEK